MSIIAFFKNILLILLAISYSTIICDNAIAATVSKENLLKTKISFIPPPIPPVNTVDFSNFVRTFHTFPSPYGYEPYQDENGKEIGFPINELNPVNAYIPVTFYCNSRISCPAYVIYTNDNVTFNYKDGDFINLITGIQNSFNQPHAIIGFYFPNDPRFYTFPAFHVVEKIKKGDPIVTILFSQKALQHLSEIDNGKPKGFLSAKGKNKLKSGEIINLPLANGKEFLTIGTTLSVISLGEAAGVEFTEVVSQTTGETFTKQIETGFTLNLSLGSDTMIGGGALPVAETVKLGINATLASLVSNGLAIANQSTVTRSYTIKPGIYDTYYWAIYQLLYSYHINAPQLETALTQAQSIWNDLISFQIAANEITKDKKLIGNTLPPQAANIANDVTVGVAVPVNSNTNNKTFSQIMTLSKP